MLLCQFWSGVDFTQNYSELNKKASNNYFNITPSKANRQITFLSLFFLKKLLDIFKAALYSYHLNFAY
jgi:hypothetical protein